ncbi:hypothetical protein WJX72_005672 [[Myrmecia] bisecta]|uniref:TIR domain-containing protein n=1 Tax=[Myrmecia] bisecta TaxID=41462 RepID=A0AAW1R7B0_9CHLO
MSTGPRKQVYICCDKWDSRILGRRIHDILAKRGFRPFLADEDTVPGTDQASVQQHAIETSHAAIVLLSEELSRQWKTCGSRRPQGEETLLWSVIVAVQGWFSEATVDERLHIPRQEVGAAETPTWEVLERWLRHPKIGPEVIADAEHGLAAVSRQAGAQDAGDKLRLGQPDRTVKALIKPKAMLEVWARLEMVPNQKVQHRTWLDLPLELQLHILSLVPVTCQKLAARFVSKAWAATLDDPAAHPPQEDYIDFEELLEGVRIQFRVPERYHPQTAP